MSEKLQYSELRSIQLFALQLIYTILQDWDLSDFVTRVQSSLYAVSSY